MSELWPGMRTAAILFPSDASFDLQNYKASNGKEPPEADYEASAYYYAPVFHLAKAMEMAGTIDDTAKISKPMVTTGVPGIVGTYQYDEKHLAQVPMSMYAAGPNAAGLWVNPKRVFAGLPALECSFGDRDGRGRTWAGA